MRSKLNLFLIFILLIAGCTKTNEPVPAGKGKIIVLMYHRLVEGAATNLYERSAKNFEADLKYFVGKGINVISLNDLQNVLTSGKMPDANSVVLTFDDGDNSWYTIVRPLILQYKVKATFFLWTNMIDHDSFLSWSEVELMSNYMYAGGERPFVFGSHSFSHQFLLQRKTGFATTDEYNSFLDYELGQSKKIIDSHTAGEASALSLPFGDGNGDPDIIAAAKRNGYKFIRTSVWGNINKPDMNLFAIPSLPVLDTTTMAFVESYLKL
jgi:peptidoglycan/xylan/chitin deacetylase (PgdA/CDA1 family)